MSLLKNNIIANYLGQVWSGIMAISFLPIYIEYLGIEAYGLIGLFVVLQSLLLLLDMGITPTLNREMARFNAGEHTAHSIRVLLRSLEVICLFIAILIIVSIWLSSGYIATGWLKPEGLSPDIISQAISIMALVIAFRFGESIYRGALYGLEKQVTYNVIYAILTTLRYAGAIIILAAISNSVLAFFIWQLIISILSVIIFSYNVYRILPQTPMTVSFSRKAIKGIKKFATGMMGITVLTAFLLYSDKLLLSNLLPLNEFGYYSLAATAASVLFMIVAPVTQAVFPKLVKLSSQDSSDELALMYHKMTQLVCVLIAPVAIVLAIFSNGVLQMWSGNIELSNNTSSYLSILVLGCLLNSLAHIPYQLQLAYGWTGLLIRVNILVVLGVIIGIYLLVPNYGAVAAAWVWLVMNGVYLIISSQFMHKRLISAEKWKWYFRDIIPPLLGALSVVVLADNFIHTESFDRFDWFIFILFVWLLSTVASVLFSSMLRSWISSKISTMLLNKA